MVKFSCFLSHINYHRSKKVVQRSPEAINLNPQENSQDQELKASFCSDNNLSSTSAEQVTSPSSHDGCWKPEVLLDNSKDFLQTMRLKKSQSLGSVLDKRRGFSGEDDETDQEFSFHYSHENNGKRVSGSTDNAGSAEVDDLRNIGANALDLHQENEVAESFQLIAGPVHPESIFSIGVLKHFDREQHDDAGEHSTDPVVDYLHLSSDTHPISVKSCSVTILGVETASSVDGARTPELNGPRSRSFEDLYSLHGGRDESLNGDDTLCSEMAFQRYIDAPYYHDATEASHDHADSREECLLSNTSGGFNEVEEGEKDDKYSGGNFKWKEPETDGVEIKENVEQGSSIQSSNTSGGFNEVEEGERDDKYSSGNFEWKEPETDGVEIKENVEQGSSIQRWDELSSEEFNIKRIEQWINQIDIQNSNIVEEPGEISSSVPKKDRQVVAGTTTARLGPNSLGMEVAYSYISSLPPTSSSALMSNLGLVAVPFLGAFVSLKVLNLSGNAIVRITSGALPRGLHMLNLSKNNISAIEGLRDLSRLRVLDLSYNRIVRIGHGLASCSSLKELYLAGNKISEVEGLHRLLKLNVLDLRLNKISTAKGLGQLAANYASLQAINLEGNPAQKNVGDEQLKKYLLSLLPHLVYYNKQAIRASGSKEITDRPPRSITTSHQFDRAMRTEQSHSRRGATYGSALHRSSSSNYSRSNVAAVIAASRQSKNHRHVRVLPPTGSKATNNHLPDAGTSSLKPSNPIRRSQSEGTL